MGKLELKAELAGALENIQTAGNELKLARNQERPSKSRTFGAVLAVEMEKISNIIEALIEDSDIIAEDPEPAE